MIIDYARASSGGGKSQILGAGPGAVHPAAAALAQGRWRMPSNLTI